jgi:S1-C subfamily serine protease
VRYYKQDWVATGVKPGGGSTGSIPLAVLFSVILLAGLGVLALLLGNFRGFGGGNPADATVFIECQWQINLADGRQVQTAGSGSGTIIHPNGKVVTNHHVVYMNSLKTQDGEIPLDQEVEASKITVYLRSGTNDVKKMEAQVIDTDRTGKTWSATSLDDMWHDWAVLQIKNPPPDLPSVRIGDSRKVGQNSKITVFGFPLGQKYEVEEGKGPAMTVVPGVVKRIVPPNPNTFFYFVHSAVVQPGNSGGPLISDATKEQVGINTRISVLRSMEGASTDEHYTIPTHKLEEVWKKHAKSHPFGR